MKLLTLFTALLLCANLTLLSKIAEPVDLSTVHIFSSASSNRSEESEPSGYQFATHALESSTYGVIGATFLGIMVLVRRRDLSS
ncbi:MAG: hypothetical protein O3C20_01810 [Verrucomicrobia bacterium]|nr:hypothetical protein [Verrucomicrobiota bacterium]